MLFFFFNDTATTEIYTLSLHDALPIFFGQARRGLSDEEKMKALHLLIDKLSPDFKQIGDKYAHGSFHRVEIIRRSEEHTSELQSRQYLVCRLLLEKKKKQ